jgi:hypothetical protein
LPLVHCGSLTVCAIAQQKREQQVTELPRKNKITPYNLRQILPSLLALKMRGGLRADQRVDAFRTISDPSELVATSREEILTELLNGPLASTFSDRSTTTA